MAQQTTTTTEDFQLPLKDFTFGADPELGVRTKPCENISAHSFFPGTKKQPAPFGNGAVQVDGTAVEYNVAPARTADEFVSNNVEMIMEARKLVREENKEYNLVALPTFNFSQQYWDSLPKSVKLIGCSPDFDAKTGEQNPPPKRIKGVSHHGGHVFIGWRKPSAMTKAHKAMCRRIVMQLAHTVGPMLQFFDRDQSRMRVTPITAFRPTPFGVEWRAPSCAWTKDPDLMRWMYMACRDSVSLLNEGYDLTASSKEVGGTFNSRLFDMLYNPDPNTGATLFNFNFLRRYHNYMQSQYNFPELPEAYIRG